MKIAFLGPAYPLRGGIVQFITILAEKLKTADHKIKIFSFKKQYPKFLFPGKDQFDHSGKKPEIEIEQVLIPYNPLTWFPTVFKIKKWNPEILILKYWIPFFAPAFGVIIRFLKLTSSTKVIYIIDNIDFHEKWIFAKTLTKFALGKADKLITLSDSVFEDTRKMFPNKKIIRSYHPLYLIFDRQRFNKKTAKKELGLTGKKVILFFGYIKPYKGLDLLLKAFPEILKNIPDAHLLIVGEVYGNDEKYLHLISELKITDKVTFIRKFVADDEVEIYFKSADVLALPYKQATQSGVAQIGYTMDLGAVATPVGGLPELVINKKTGIVAKSVTSQDFAKAIEEFFKLDKNILRKNIAIENQKYSWENFIKLIFNE
ncbi:MAG: hypothetical protein DRZ79_02000 [Candidatus Cloacimonadota bacterium]|nr:MAG: hypothetical protein DRZ79_02000 [Candidatus Cloacimonadota bacterium]